MVEILKDQITATALGTLAATTALQVINAKAQTGIRPFLMKKVITNAVLRDPDADDIITIGIARGESSLSEIEQAMSVNQLTRDDPDQALVRHVLHETLRMFPVRTAGEAAYLHYEVSVGGGGGIPFDEDEGWQVFVFNSANTAQVAGALIAANLTYYGVWL